MVGNCIILQFTKWRKLVKMMFRENSVKFVLFWQKKFVKSLTGWYFQCHFSMPIFNTYLWAISRKIWDCIKNGYRFRTQPSKVIGALYVLQKIRVCDKWHRFHKVFSWQARVPNIRESEIFQASLNTYIKHIQHQRTRILTLNSWIPHLTHPTTGNQKNLFEPLKPTSKTYNIREPENFVWTLESHI